MTDLGIFDVKVNKNTVNKKIINKNNQNININGI